MKHSDFLAALKTLKSHYEKRRNKQTPYATLEKQQKHCICKDSSGESKYLYASQKEMEYLLSSKFIRLQSYPCPYEKGWHLTKG